MKHDFFSRLTSFKFGLTLKLEKHNVPYSTRWIINISIQIMYRHFKNSLFHQMYLIIYMSYTLMSQYTSLQANNTNNIINISQATISSQLLNINCSCKSLKLFPLHVKNATSVDTFKCLYLKWKRLNDHWIISITTATLILYFVMI